MVQQNDPDKLLNYQVLLRAKIGEIVIYSFIVEIYNKQSAATLQKSVHAYSMPKGNRFENRPKYQG